MLSLGGLAGGREFMSVYVDGDVNHGPWRLRNHLGGSGGRFSEAAAQARKFKPSWAR